MNCDAFSWLNNDKKLFSKMTRINLEETAQRLDEENNIT